VLCVRVCDGMKVYGRLKVYLHSFLTLARGTDEWSASRPSCCNPKEQAAHMPIEQEPEWDSACLHALEKSSMPYSAGDWTVIPRTCSP